jgi:cell division protein ZapA
LSEVRVSINGRDYQVACEDGQEQQLEKLARFVDTKMGELIASVGQIGDARLLVMTSLLIADELSDAYKQLEAGAGGNGASKGAEDSMATALEACAQSIESIAARLDHA